MPIYQAEEIRGAEPPVSIITSASALTASKNRREAEKFLIWDTKIVGVNIGRRLVTAGGAALS